MGAMQRMTVLALALAVAAPAAAQEDFGEREVRALLPKAAAGDPATVRTLAERGPPPTDRELRALGSVPLTHLLLLAPASSAPDALRRDYRTVADGNPSVTDLLGALYGTEGRRKDFPSVLHEEHLTEVTCVRTGDSARGEVRFSAPGAFEGRAEWTARRTAGAWQIVEFVVPSWRLRVRLDGTTWKAERVDRPDGPWYPSVESLSVPDHDLPISGTVMDLPDAPTLIAITADGTLRFGRQQGGSTSSRRG